MALNNWGQLTTVELFYRERPFKDNVRVVDYDLLFFVIGNQYFLQKAMDFYVDFLNAKLPDSSAIVLILRHTSCSCYKFPRQI